MPNLSGANYEKRVPEGFIYFASKGRLYLSGGFIFSPHPSRGSGENMPNLKRNSMLKRRKRHVLYLKNNNLKVRGGVKR